MDHLGTEAMALLKVAPGVSKNIQEGTAASYYGIRFDLEEAHLAACLWKVFGWYHGTSAIPIV